MLKKHIRCIQSPDKRVWSENRSTSLSLLTMHHCSFCLSKTILLCDIFVWFLHRNISEWYSFQMYLEVKHGSRMVYGNSAFPNCYEIAFIAHFISWYEYINIPKAKLLSFTHVFCETWTKLRFVLLFENSIVDTPFTNINQFFSDDNWIPLFAIQSNYCHQFRIIHWNLLHHLKCIHSNGI